MDEPRRIQVGVNWTNPVHLPLIRELLSSGSVDFCEILIDNFLHVPPQQLAEALGDVPCSFHIMNSRFLERSEEELIFIASRIRASAQVLHPLYVSDHLLRFTVGGREMFLLPELDYEVAFEGARERVAWWQSALETRVYFENYPSMLDTGLRQPEFFEELMSDTGAGLLFDFSNAICAKRNCGVELSRWDRPLKTASHFHVGGYELSSGEPLLAIDTHGHNLAEDTNRFMRSALSTVDYTVTICVERDRDVRFEAWMQDLRTTRELQGTAHA